MRVSVYTLSHLVAQLQSVPCGSQSAGASTCLTLARPDSEPAARRMCSCCARQLHRHGGPGKPYCSTAEAESVLLWEVPASNAASRD